MDIDPRIVSILLRAEEQCARGLSPSPEELCRDCPELVEPVREQLHRLVDAAPLFDTSQGTRDTSTPRRPARPAGGMPIVPGYEVLEEIGRGGMGIVYKARQLSLKRFVALKMILAGLYAEESELIRFQAEAETAAQLQHPNIVQVHEIGRHDGLPYFSLELITGGSLARKLNGKPIPPMEAAGLIETLARAVQAAHQQGIVHRDLKPGNVLLTEDGSPRITDFGLAKQMHEGSGRTRTGAVIGTPAYMAPEQAEGRVRDVGPPADIHALGAMLYEMLTGRPPFVGESAIETIERVRTQEPVPPSRLVPRLPHDLETICLKCLHKDPDSRYRSALALAQDVERFRAGEPILGRREGMTRKLLRLVGRHKTAIAAWLGTILTAALVTIFTIREGRHQAERRADMHVEDAIKAFDGTARSLAGAEELIEKLQAIDPARAVARREELHQRLADWINGRLDQHSLGTDDRRDVDANLALLDARDSTRAATLRVRRDRRFSRAESTFDLSDGRLDKIFHPGHVARRDDGSVERKSTGIAGLLTRVACKGQIEFEAVVDVSRDQSTSLGLILNGGIVPDAIHSVAMTPDGRTVATGERDGSVRLWHAFTGRPLADLGRGDPNRPIGLVAVGPRLIAVCCIGQDVVVRSWDTTSRLLHDEVRIAAPATRALAISAAGNRLATAEKDGTIRLWSLPQGTGEGRLAGLPAGDRPILALSRDGSSIAASNGPGVFVWDRERGGDPLRLEPHRGRVTCLSFGMKNDRLASAGEDGAAHLWDLPSGRKRSTYYTTHSAEARCLSLSPDGKSLLVGDTTTVRVFDTASERDRALPSPDAWSSCWSADGRSIVLGCTGLCSLIDLDGGNAPVQIGNHSYQFLLEPVRSDHVVLKPGRRFTLEDLAAHGGVVRLKIVRNNHLLRQQERTLAAGRITLRARREGERLRFQANDTEEMIFRDLIPGGPNEGVFGLHLSLDARLIGLRAEHSPLPTDMALERGDEMFGRGDLDAALAYYQSQARTAALPAVQREADCKAALCLLALRRPASVVPLLDRTARADAPPDEPWPLLAAFRLWAVHLRNADQSRAEEMARLIEDRDHGCKRSALVISPDEQAELLRLYMEGGGLDRYFFLNPDEMTRRRRAWKLAEGLGTSPGLQRRTQFELVSGLRATGQESEAMELFEQFRTSFTSDVAQDPQRAGLLWHRSWMLRLAGRLDDCRDELRAWPKGFEAAMLMERCRLHAALGRLREALADLQAAWIAEPVPVYTLHCERCLMESFLHEQLGDTAKALEARRRAQHRRWARDLNEADRHRLLRLGPLPMICDWIACSMSGELSDEQAKSILDRLSGQLGGNVLLLNALGSARPTPSVLRQAWASKRGKECARQFVFQTVSYADYIRLPVVVLSAEYFAQNAFAGPMSESQADLIQRLSRDGTTEFFEGRLTLKQVTDIVRIWTGWTGWTHWEATLEGTLPEKLRGPVAYLLGHRSERLPLKSAQALSFFQSAARSAAADVKSAAEVELKRLAGK